MDILKPIFIIGAGRSGSTLFHKLFSSHPKTAWLSGICARYPDKPQFNQYVMNLIDLPILDNLVRRFFEPGEVYRFWEYYFPGFGAPIRDLSKMDVDSKTKSRLYRAMAAVLNNKRSRLLIKITGWPRVGFLTEIFPGIKFIHVVRDGRAVANSLLGTHFWRGWQGPENWRWGKLTPTQEEIWERHDRSFVALAGIQWNILIDAFQESRTCIHPDNYIEIKYEDICTDPEQLFVKVSDFCELQPDEDFLKHIRKTKILNANTKWQTDLTPEQQRILESIVKKNLELYGYI